MLVVEQAKALALKLNNPARVLQSIPTAKTLNWNGTELTVLPHGLQEVRVLRNLGIKAPSPILYHYDWPGRFTPYEHQRMTAAFLTVHPRCLVLNEIGTGKTQSALWAADYLMKQGLVKRCLIMSPLSTLERVWNDAIFKEFIHRKAVVLHGTAAKRKQLLATENDFYIVNHDGFKIIAEQAKDMFDLVIVDEAAVLRNAGTSRFKVFNRWISKHPETRLWLMTGTPTPNEPTDAWALAKLANSPFVPRTFTSFRDQTMVKIGMHSWVPRPDATETVYNILQPSIRYSRDECFDLPDTIVQTRQVPLSTEQAVAYDKMLKKLVIELSDEDAITAVNEAVKIQKLVQIACGVAYSDDGSYVEIDAKGRIAATCEVIEEAGEKVIVFVPLTGTLKMLERELAKRWNVAVVNGATPANQRNAIFQSFQNTPKGGGGPDVLVAHPATMAHGLTLTAASTIVWYGPITSNEQYTQANGRVERIGKRTVSNVVHIQATKLEQRMFDRLKNKQKLQGVLLDLIEKQKEH